MERKWYGAEMNAAATGLFKDYLFDQSISYEASEAYNLTHFECYMTEDEVNAANDWMLAMKIID